MFAKQIVEGKKNTLSWGALIRKVETVKKLINIKNNFIDTSQFIQSIKNFKDAYPYSCYSIELVSSKYL